ncbi:uncharacterized protein [Typha latifolia]|uniref:uncharacterized protein n=1 Tax=Typha latifolia TaxID=4733 RepID=UPI003C2FE3A2
MSVAVCRSSAAPFQLPNWLAPPEERKPADTPAIHDDDDDERPGQFDIWSSIQSQNAAKAPPVPDVPPQPYVHPLLRRSLSLLSQKSLEICTESLGSETGSDDFSDDMSYCLPEKVAVETEVVTIGAVSCYREVRQDRKELVAVNYHCSASRRSPQRSFPPPLPSISRRDGPCFQMRPHRRDGRLVVEAISVPSHNYLHARRQDGRLCLSFVDATAREPTAESDANESPEIVEKQASHEDSQKLPQEEEVEVEAEEEEVGEEEEEEEMEEEEEEEVEVVDRGTIVEVKVSTQPQQQSGAAAAAKVHRSSLVINKFVGGTPLIGQAAWAPKRTASSTTTAAAAAVAASALSATGLVFDGQSTAAAAATENKLLFTAKRRDKEELLHHMQRCSQLRRPLFIWEPCCIATSS